MKLKQIMASLMCIWSNVGQNNGTLSEPKSLLFSHVDDWAIQTRYLDGYHDAA
jgi:hypothetical protein